MTEQTDKIKICDIIVDCFTKEGNFKWSGHLVPKLADALIAAGIGDVSEYKHRAERAERALYNMAYGEWQREGARRAICEKYAPNTARDYLDRAEKELAEEMKDENI